VAKKQVEAIILKYIELLRKKKVHVEKVILFGSHASGRVHKESDIDVAIISPDLGRDRIEETVALKKMAEQINYDIFPRPYSLEQYHAARRGEFLYDEIICKGKVVV